MKKTTIIEMKTATIIWLLLPLFFALSVLLPSEEVQAQPQPTTAQGFQLRNQAGEEVSLTLPTSGVSSYNVLFPTTAPGTGSLLLASNNSGQMSWLASAPDASVLVMSGGLPAWQNPNSLFWGITGNSGTNMTNNFIGTTDYAGIAFRTDNVERMIIGPGGNITMSLNTTVNGIFRVHGKTELGDNIANDTLLVTARMIANGNRNTIGSNTSNQQLTVDGIADAVVGNTLAGNPTLWDAVVDGDLVATGLIKAGGSMWIDGVTPNNHQVVANDVLNVGTNTAANLTFSTNNTAAVSINGSTQQVNVNSALNLSGAATPLLANGAAGTAGNTLISGGAGTTPSWMDPNGLFWGLTGNSGTNAATNFIGTTDAVGLSFRTNNTERMVIGSGGNVTVALNATVNGHLTVDGNALLGNSASNDTVLVEGRIVGNGNNNRIGDNGAVQQLTIDGVADAVIGNTLAGNPTVWDAVVDGDLVATGIVKSGGSLWIDGVTPNNHQVVANDVLNVGTNAAANLTLSTNNTAAVSINGSTQQVNVNSALNLSGAATPLLANGAAGSAGNVFISGGNSVTPSWVNPNGLFWQIGGNTIVGASTDFLGTTNDRVLAFRTNNVERARVETDGDLVVGATNSSTRLRVAGGDIGLDQGRQILFDSESADPSVLLRNQTGLISIGAEDFEAAAKGGMHFLVDYNNTDSNGEDFVWAQGDEAPGNANYEELMRLTQYGRLGIGTNNPTGVLTILSDNKSDIMDDVVIRTHSDTSTPLVRFVRSRGTFASPTHLQSNDIIGRMSMRSSLASAGAEIWAVADANHSASDFSTRLEFRTTNGTSTATQVTIDDDGRVGMGTTTPNGAVTLHVVGAAGKTAGGTTWVNLSDARLKDVQGEYAKGLNDILDLRPVVFRYKPDNPWGAASDVDQYGYIAQEVETVFPEAVETGDDGYLVFNMHPILVAYTNAVKELNAELEDQKTVNAEMQTLIEELNARVTDLERQSRSTTTQERRSPDVPVQ